jgi:hypothetical protein
VDSTHPDTQGTGELNDDEIGNFFDNDINER